jgi:iron complex outermembrane receptor protein
MIVRYILLLLLGFCLICTPARAQQADTLQLEDVVVSANRVGLKISETDRTVQVVRMDQLRNLPITSVADVLGYIAGVDVQQRGPVGVQADIAIRGATFNQTLVLINGVMVSDPQTGHHNLNLPLQPQDIDRIEVLKGPGAKVYGQNAFAGAINIITKTGDKTGVRLAATGGDFGLYDVGASVQLPRGRYKQLLSLNRRAANSFINSDNTDFGMSTAFYNGVLQGAKQDVNVTAGYNARQFGARNFYVPDPREYESTEAMFLNVGYRGKGALQFAPQAYWRRHFDDYRQIRNLPDTLRNRHTTDVLGFQFNARRVSRVGIMAVGGDFRNENIVSTNLGNSNRTNAGLYIEYRLLLWQRLSITPGMYTNYFTGYGINAFPGLDLGFTVNENIRLIGNVGRSFRVPTYTEQFFNRGRLNQRVYGSDTLRAEDSWGGEAGVRFTQNGIAAQATAYLRNARQLIDLAKFLSGPPTVADPFVFRNVEQIQTMGVEAELTLLPRQWWGSNFPLSKLRVAYNYIDISRTPTSFTSRYLFNYLNHQGIVEAHGRIAGRLHASAAFKYENRISLPQPYMLLDARLYWDAKNWRVFVEGSNLTNTTYGVFPGVQLPGRWLRAGFIIEL